MKNLNPFVFLTVNGLGSIVVTPNDSHTSETWEKVKGKIVNTYINECIRGEHRPPDGKCEGVGKALKFFERHAQEWNCTYIQGVTIPNWLLVE